ALWEHTENANDIGHEEGTHRTSGGLMPGQLCRLLEVLQDLHFRETWDWSLASLELHFDPWAEPPESVVAEGLKSVRGYFEELYADPCRIKRRSVKVILVKQEGAQKTSSRQSMEANEA
ncbi:unnamed protein product, partial [Ectocarpus sp. 6 AP-2014]